MRTCMILALIMLLGCTEKQVESLPPENLLVEFLKSPLMVDETRPRMSWTMPPGREQNYQTGYQILVASDREKLNDNIGDLWDSGKIESSLSQNIIYEGAPLSSEKDCFWKVKIWDEHGNQSNWSAINKWKMGLLNPQDWNAEWIATENKEDLLECHQIRKNFQIEEFPESAFAYINMLGYYELYVNGEKVEDHVLTPAVSDYSSHSVYNAYDIKDYLRKGKNTIGLWTAPGWYRKDTREYYGISEDLPLLRGTVRLGYGEKDVQINTDRTWKIARSDRSLIGKWLWGNFGGEKVDGRLSKENWSKPEFDDSDWKQVYNYKPSKVSAIAERCPPTRIIEAIPEAAREQLNDSTFLIDFGKHLTGFLNLKMTGLQSGEMISINYVDKIITPGQDTSPLEMNFTKGVKGDKEKRRFVLYNQLDEYIGAGLEVEHFRNKFNYHAFRYILINGLSSDQILNVEAEMIGNDIEQVTSFKSSNELFNEIWEMINHTYRCLTYNGYIVDCAHRERIGYGGDSHSSLEAGLSNFDLSAFLNKWAIDWRANNYPTGFWTNSAPEPPQHNYNFNPGWGSFGIVLPWQFYVYYGDTVNLGRAYPLVKKYVNYMKLNVDDGILHNDYDRANYSRSFIGDWVPPGYDMTKEGRVDSVSTQFFNNCIYIYAVQMAAKMARVLGKSADLPYYEGLIDDSKDRIHEVFFNPETRDYGNGEQTYLALPLLIGLVPEELKNELDEKLEYLIRVTNNGHLQTGMLGTYFLLKYLMETDRNDLIYLIMNQKTYPGYGFMIESGATTVWEQWNGHNSQTHNCYLAGGMWFLQGLGGIRPDESHPGFKRFFISQPYLPDLDFVNINYKSPYGLIENNWENMKDRLVCNIRIPPNTSGIFKVPTIPNSKVLLDDEEQRNLTGSHLDELLLTPGNHKIELIKQL